METTDRTITNCSITPAAETAPVKRQRLTLELWTKEVGADPAKVAALSTADRAAIVPLWREAKERSELIARATRLRKDADEADAKAEALYGSTMAIEAITSRVLFGGAS